MSGSEQYYENGESIVQSLIREQVYGIDLGQLNWQTLKELRSHVRLLDLQGDSTVLELGCGMGGAMRYLAGITSSSFLGVDRSGTAVDIARKSKPLASRENMITYRQFDFEKESLVSLGKFNAAFSTDVVNAVRDRRHLFGNVRDCLRDGGRFVFSDGSVLTGLVAASEVSLRSGCGDTFFCAPNCNPELLEASGFTVVKIIDTTEDMCEIATRLLDARLNYRKSLYDLDGEETFESDQRFLKCVIKLANEKQLSRHLYVAEAC